MTHQKILSIRNAYDINKHDLMDELVDNGNIIHFQDRICNKLHDHFSSNGKRTLKVQRI